MWIVNISLCALSLWVLVSFIHIAGAALEYRVQYQDQRRKDVQMVNARGIQTLRVKRIVKNLKGVH